MSLLDIISNEGVAAAIGTLPKRIKDNEGAVAETIENNVRKKIIKDQYLDPAFFDEMSKLLDELIKQRKANALSYEDYLKKIAELAKQANKGHSDDAPKAINSPGKRALYNNLEKDESLVILLDKTMNTNNPADWRGNLAKENVVKSNIYQSLVKNLEREGPTPEELVAEPPNGYGLPKKVEKIFEIIKGQQEY